MAAVLFKVEAAVRNGYTSTMSSLCQWNQLFTKKVHTGHDMQLQCPEITSNMNN